MGKVYCQLAVLVGCFVPKDEGQHACHNENQDDYDSNAKGYGMSFHALSISAV